MDQERQPRVRAGRIDLVLPGPDHAEHDRVDRLQVARVGGQLDLDVGPRLADTYLPTGTEVVLHVARPLDRRRVDVALELAEDLVVALADDVGQHVQPAAVGHADDGAVEVGVGGGRQDPVQDGRSPTRPLQTEALRADVLGGQEPLERLGGVEPSRRWRSSSESSWNLTPRPSTGSSAAPRSPGCACTRCRWSGSTRRAARRAARPGASSSLPATPPVRNSRSRSQIVRP